VRRPPGLLEDRKGANHAGERAPSGACRGDQIGGAEGRRSEPNGNERRSSDPTAAWSRRVRRIGGLIQAAFAAFWLLRGSVVIGGRVADVLIAVFGVTVIGVFFYAIRATAGTATRPRSPEAKRIERAVTVATVIEFAAAFALPVVVIAAVTPTGSCRRSRSRSDRCCCGSTTESISPATGRSDGR
jgi:hypothetical protein